MNCITIGKGVLVGGDCCIYDSDFHPLSFKERARIDEKAVKTAPILVEDSVFLGTRCTILKNSEIGFGSVIGAGSLVAGRIPGGELWAGVPARRIRVIE